MSFESQAVAKSVVSENGAKVLKKQKLLWPREDGSTETVEEMFGRVAQTVSAAEKNWQKKDDTLNTQLLWGKSFYDLMASGKFIPNSPTLGNAGKPNGQLAACFVLPIPDSISGIYGTLKATAEIQASGGGTGFSGGRLRSKGSPVGTTGKTSDGNIPFIELYNFSSKRVLVQGSARKGANMWVVPAHHADVEEFIDLKKDPDSPITQFNISVGATDAFMDAVVRDDTGWALYNPQTNCIVKRVHARALFDQIIENAWRTGDPGLFFLDRANRDNPTPALGDYEATNPCGEQPLLPYEACTLGHINLGKFVLDQDHDGQEWSSRIKWAEMENAVYAAIRFLDDVVEINKYPIPEIEKMHKLGNRKIGLGVLGFADMLVQLGIPYDSAEAIQVSEMLAHQLRDWADEASCGLAEERGPFPNWEKSIYAGRAPRRNACVLTIAPTGTTGIILGASTGIEPFFGLVIMRLQAGMEMYEVHAAFQQWLDRKFGRSMGGGDSKYTKDIIAHVAKTGSIKGAPHLTEREQGLWVQANDVSWKHHIDIQATWQKYVDSAVSKTINMPNSATREEIREAYMYAWKSGCKGITVYRDGSKFGQALNIVKEEKPQPVEASDEKLSTVLDRLSEDELAHMGYQRIPQQPLVQIGKERNRVTQGAARKLPTGCGNAFIFIGEGQNGRIDDVMGRLGKSGGCAAAWWEALCRVTSLASRSGVAPEEIAKQLGGISCHLPTMYANSPFRVDGQKPPQVTSCADALSKAIMEHIAERDAAAKEEEAVTVVGTAIRAGVPNANGDVFATDVLVKADVPKAKVVDKKPIGFSMGYATFNKHAGACPECGSSSLDRGGGCITCTSCGFSRC